MPSLLTLFLLAVSAVWAHVGSPDVFYDGNAGPYRILVTVRPPLVIPGVAEVEIRSTTGDVQSVRIVPLPLGGPGAQFAPTPDVARRSGQDPQFFTGSLWMMKSGSWQVRIHADGARGIGEVSVPVPALAQRTRTMQKSLGALLFSLMLLLGIGAVSIVGAGVREGQLEPGLQADAGRKRRARVAMAVTAGVVLAALYLGNEWWKAEASTYGRNVFKPLELIPTLQPGGRLSMRLRDPGWLSFRKVDDLIPDHDHIMHLYVFREPGMERVWHLHPKLVGPGELEQALPAVPAGHYRLFGDIVHQDGLPETVVARLELPDIAGEALAGDDSAGSGPPLAAGRENTVSELGGGYRMVWQREPGPLRAKRPSLFRFQIEDSHGKPATGMELYMGMPGHAAFVKRDFSVFAHIHPSGSVPMASLGLAQNPADGTGNDPHAAHMAMMHEVLLPPVVTFPYGFPQPGEYRIIVQVKRAGKIETGVFDARVEN